MIALLDLPAPLFDAVDSALQIIPAAWRIAAYAGVCAWLGMFLYRRLSDQARLRTLRDDVKEVQSQLAGFDGEFAQLRPLLRRNFTLTLRQLALTLRPALGASLPLLFVLPWLSNRFAYEAPTAGLVLHACAIPNSATADLHWNVGTQTAEGGCWLLTWPSVGTIVRLVDASGTELFASSAARSGVLERFAAFNYVIGNPDGYLPASAPIQRLVLNLAPQQIVTFGPNWLRGWEAWFFATMVIVSLVLKLRWRVI